jgi:peroxiredoxin
MVPQQVPQPGDEAPDFRLRGPGGALYTLSEHRGHDPVVLVFFPLAFSPTCGHQLPDLQRYIPRFEAAGAIVYGISVDSHWVGTAYARSLGLTFPLLSDWKREASTAYGVLIPEASISGRATFVIGRDGRVKWVDAADDLDAIESIPSPERALAALAEA